MSIQRTKNRGKFLTVIIYKTNFQLLILFTVHMFTKGIACINQSTESTNSSLFCSEMNNNSNNNNKQDLP